MTKNRIITIALIVLLIISVVSVTQNFSRASEQNRIRRTMINRVYAELKTISFDLGGLVNNIENEVTGYEANRQSLVMLSRYFARLDIILRTYAISFPPKGTIRNVYSGNPFNFEFISYTLTAGTGTANGVPYAGITADGLITKNEVRYLLLLRDDIDVIIAAMVSAENPPQENQNLTSAQIDEIFSAFTSKWSFDSEDSPYFLLRSE